MKRLFWMLIGAVVVPLLSGATPAQNRALTGRVTADGKGVAGVAVTDGTTIVRTNAKGIYTLPATADAEFVYFTCPDGYEAPLKLGSPQIYQRIEAGKTRYDFALSRSEVDATNHRLVVLADPQVYADEDVDSVRRAARDMRLTAADGVPTFGVVCGDIIGDITRQPSLCVPVCEALAECGFPISYAIGNHDINIGVRSNEPSKKSFKEQFGPTYYSFDRGRVHYVVLDDNFYIGRSYLYVGYLDERQLRWLEQDLSAVPAGRTVVVCFHIPTWSREARRKAWGKEESNKILNNRQALYDILKPYNAHIMSGHEHYQENYVLGDHLFEHVHGPLSTYFWQTPMSMDGVPALYHVYEVRGDEITWYLKAVDYPRERQFIAYGVGEDRHHPDEVTVNVWNWDAAWTIEWEENGVAKGAMEQFTGFDEATFNYGVLNQKNFRFPYFSASDLTEHLFKARPSDPKAHIRVKVTDRFGRIYLWDSVAGYTSK